MTFAELKSAVQPTGPHSFKQQRLTRMLVAGLLVSTIILAGVIVYQQGQISTLSHNLSNSTGSQSNGGTQCVQIGMLGNMSLKVVDSAGNPIKGANVTGTVSVICGYISFPNTTIMQYQLEPQVTPANGTVSNFSPLYVGNYTLAVHVGNSVYPVISQVTPGHATIVTLTVPSGRYNETTYFTPP
jgi:hypothetical protein